MIDFSPIENLKIKEVFIGCGMETLLEEIEKIEDYLIVLFDETSRSNVWVTDDLEQHCIFIKDTKGINKDKLLKVYNERSISLFLWRIDGVMFSHKTKCDCALLHEKKLHFVEFKANVESSNPLSIREHYEKAQAQLKITYDKFKELYHNKGINLFEVLEEIDAQIVFDKTVPRDNAFCKKIKRQFLKENEICLNIDNEIYV